MRSTHLGEPVDYIQPLLQTQQRRKECNLAQFEGSSSICTEDGEESRDCNPDICRKHRIEEPVSSFPFPSNPCGLERLDLLERVLHLLRAGGQASGLSTIPR